MTVKELIEKLQDFDPQMEVEFAYNYGDYWRTEVTKHITEVEEEAVTYSDYHRMNKVVDSREDDDVVDEKMVVLLR
jgi:Zn-finger domain-containing protein